MKKCFVLVVLTIGVIAVASVACGVAPTITPVPVTSVPTNTPVPAPTITPVPVTSVPTNTPVPAPIATPTLLPAPELVGAFPASAFVMTRLVISPNPDGAEGKIEFPPQQSGNNWVIFQIPGVEGEYHLNVYFTDLGAVDEWGGEVKFPLAVCPDCSENHDGTFSFEGFVPLSEVLEERNLAWSWGDWYLDNGCFVISQSESITLYYRQDTREKQCPQCKSLVSPYGTWCVSIVPKLCEEPEDLKGIPRGNIGGHEYVGYWEVSPSGHVIGIPFYNNEWDFFLNAPVDIPTCRWPVGMKGNEYNLEILWVGEPEYIECMMRIDN